MSRPELRVTLAPQGSDHALRFSRHDRHLALGSRPEPGRLAPLKASLTEDLGLVRRALGRDGEVISWEAARAAVAEIKKIGGWLLHDLLGADSARAEELESFLRYVVPEWREGAFGEVEARIEPSPACPPELATFPFEFLPVFDRALPGPIANLHELAQAVSGVLGYAAVLVRHRNEDAWTDPLQAQARGDQRTGAGNGVPRRKFAACGQERDRLHRVRYECIPSDLAVAVRRNTALRRRIGAGNVRGETGRHNGRRRCCISAVTIRRARRAPSVSRMSRGSRFASASRT